MLNHIHGIIQIINMQSFVGAIHESPLQRIANAEFYRDQRHRMLIPGFIG